MSEEDDQLAVCAKADARANEAGTRRDGLCDCERKVALNFKRSDESGNAFLLEKGAQSKVARSRKLGAEIKFFNAREEPLKKLFRTAACERSVATSTESRMRPMLRENANWMRAGRSDASARKGTVPLMRKRRIASMLQQNADRVRRDFSSAALTRKRAETPPGEGRVRSVLSLCHIKRW
jgi:hypothetical protein